MTKKIYTWACVGIVSSIALLSLIGVLLLIRALSDILWSQEAAGWVQAIGSVAAILAAIGIAQYQYKIAEFRELERDRENRFQVSNTVYSIAHAAQVAVQDIIEVSSTKKQAELLFSINGLLDRKHLARCVAALTSIPAYELATGDGAIALIAAISAMEHCMNHIDRMHSLFVNPQNGNWEDPRELLQFEFNELKFHVLELRAMRDRFAPPIT